MKYGVYIDSLRHAIAQRLERQGERKLHESLRVENDYGNDVDDGYDDEDEDELPYDEG